MLIDSRAADPTCVRTDSPRESPTQRTPELYERAANSAVIPDRSGPRAELMTRGGPPSRRPATRYDKDLLRAIFTDSRSSCFAALPVPLAVALLEVQFRAHRNDRALHWPHAVDQVIEVRGVPAGRVTVSIGDDEIRIIDLALLPGFRGQGIAQKMLNDVRQEAAEVGLPLRMTAAQQRDGRPLWPTPRRAVVGGSDTNVEWEASMGEPFLGEIREFFGPFVPAGWALCDGQLRPISSYRTLFELLGDQFGGDASGTFALPMLWGGKLNTRFIIAVEDSPARSSERPPRDLPNY